jgi:hypothetical protein
MALRPETRFPSPPPAPPPEAPPSLRLMEPQPVKDPYRSWPLVVTNVVGAVLVMLGVQMSWLHVAGAGYGDSFVVPLAFLWQGHDAATSAFTIGRVFMAIAAVGILATPFRATSAIRALAGSLLVIAAVAYVVQLVRWDSRAAGAISVRAGAVVTLAGAMLMLVDARRKKAAQPGR